MKRRELLSLLGGAVAWPLAARAQKEDRKRLAIVMNLPEHDLEAQRGSQALVLKLRELGWLEGRNLDLDFRWAADRVGDLPGIVKEIASLKPDAIVGRSGAVALALRQGAGAIPIVFVDVVDPIDVGLGQSLARPGGNITGFMNFDPAMGTKWLEIIKEIAPSLRRVGVLLYPQQSQELIFKAIADAASVQSASKPTPPSRRRRDRANPQRLCVRRGLRPNRPAKFRNQLEPPSNRDFGCAFADTCHLCLSCLCRSRWLGFVWDRAN